jgi:hypothetical protein
VEQLQQILSSGNIRFGTELAMQADVAAVLTAAGVSFLAEHRLDSRSRIDFLAGEIGIECKIDGSPATVLRQCRRYMEFAEISGLILLTSKPRHRWSIEDLGGKPFSVIWVGASFL